MCNTIESEYRNICSLCKADLLPALPKTLILYLDFQKYILELKNRGIILAVVSKNEDKIAKLGLDHKNSYLNIKDFSAFVANWNTKSSNIKDYGGFTKDFSTQMLFGANEVELGKQWANNKIITNLNETYEPFGTLRRGEHITVLIKQTNKEISGEFLGRLVLGIEDDEVKIFGATIY
mgnify:CR=1 FL=1